MGTDQIGPSSYCKDSAFHQEAGGGGQLLETLNREVT